MTTGEKLLSISLLATGTASAHLASVVQSRLAGGEVHLENQADAIGESSSALATASTSADATLITSSGT